MSHRPATLPVPAIPVLLALVLAAPLCGQTRLGDLNPTRPTTTEEGAALLASAEVAGRTWLIVRTHGREVAVWSSDGTTAGTRVAADDGVHGLEPWSTDGVPATAAMQGDLAPGAGSSDPHSFQWAPLAPYAYCLANGDLWGVGGSGATPYLLGHNIVEYAANGIDVWYAETGTFGREVYHWNFLSGVSAPAIDVRPGSNGSDPLDFVPMGAHFLFTANDGVHGREPYISDGTGPGTHRIDVRAGASSIGAIAARVTTNGVFFVTDGDSGTTELWFANTATAAATRLATGAGAPQGAHGDQAALSVSNPRATKSIAVFLSDGTAAGTRELPIGIGRQSNSVGRGNWMGLPNGKVLFPADDGVHGAEPWVTDGTPASTHQVLDVRPGPEGSFDRWSGVIDDGRTGFVADDGVHGHEPWVTDGTAGGTIGFDLNPGSASSDPLARKIGDRVFLLLDDGVHGREPWVSDALGLRLLKDVAPGPFGSSILLFDHLAMAGDRLVTVLDDGVHGREPWSSDGTPGGTQLLADIAPGSASGVDRILAGDGRVWFRVVEPGLGFTIWVTDGTPAGTHRAHIGVFGLYTEVSGRLLFWDAGRLKSTDGSSTQDLAPLDISTDWTSGRIENLCLFRGDDGEPWRTDGTTAGTFRIADLAPGSAESSPSGFVAAGRSMFFTADDGTHGRELYRYDLRSASLTLVKDIASGCVSSNPGSMIPAGDGDRIVFTAFEPSTGVELWRSDGTASGTFRLADLRTGPLGSNPDSLARIGSKIFFSADDGIHGAEPWVLDLAAVGGHLFEIFSRGGWGSFGFPSMRALSTPTIANQGFGFAMDHGLPGSGAVLLVHALRSETRLNSACMLWVALPAVQLPAVITGQGVATVPVPIAADPSLLGIELFAQFAALDPQGCAFGSFSLSDAAQVVIGS